MSLICIGELILVCLKKNTQNTDRGVDTCSRFSSVCLSGIVLHVFKGLCLIFRLRYSDIVGMV